MPALPQIDELFVVSDLHLGGGRGRQIFKQGEPFKQLIELLLKRPKVANQVLAINGDLVDFLAEPNALYFDPVGAVDKLDRIFHDEAFTPVWDALRLYLKASTKTSTKQLVITLGNHDLELVLPVVREYLLQQLSDGDASARDRITLAFTREGYSCQIADAKVLCVHGNEVDSWNVTNWDKLGQIAQDVSSGIGWVPNGGSRLVVDVMNPIKAKHPFVDLLKPETDGVLPTLAILDPTLVSKIAAASPSWFRSRWDNIKMTFGFLGDEAATAIRESRQAAMAMGHMLGEKLDEPRFRYGSYNVEKMLEKAEERMRDGVTPLSLAGGAENTDFLSVMGAIWNAVTLRPRSEVLREALEKLNEDMSFGLRSADDVFRDMDKRTNSDVTFLITGHTHLERALHLSGQDRFYYNTGTWVRLMQLTQSLLKDEKSFTPVYDALESSDIVDLDDAIKGSLVLLRPTVAAIWAKDSQARGELRQVADKTLEPTQGTQFARS